jgi:predicted short-subunit dehydrogenase-like oxidoreductase (DUF2520 family)
MALGVALRAAGHSVNIAITRTAQSAKRAASLLETRGVSVGSKGLSQLSRADRELFQHSSVLLIATPDDSIAQVAKQAAILLTGIKAASVALHTSGALTSEVLNPLRDRGVAAGSIHPLISISGQTQRALSFSETHFAVEGDQAAIRASKQLVRDLGGDSFVIDTKTKPLYHAAALMASPNLTALVDIAVEMLTRCDISPARARQILLPLINSTVENLVRHDPRHSLTGTFKRGDIDTVRMHLGAIASERLTDAMRAYVTLAKRSLSMSEISRTKKLAIESLLDQANQRLKPALKSPNLSRDSRIQHRRRTS